MQRQPFISRVQIESFRSIASCDVQLGSLMFIVGGNGSGKSNFLDALRFIADALRGSLDKALDARAGLAEVRRRTGAGRPPDVKIGLQLNLDAEAHAWYEITLGSSDGQARIKAESCRVVRDTLDVDEFTVFEGQVQGIPDAPPSSPDRLYLEAAAARREFREVYDKLSTMSFYNLAPDRMRELVSIGGTQQLAPDGRNIAAAISHLKAKLPERKARIEEYLAAVLPGIQGIEYRPIAGYATVSFRQNHWRFDAKQMSDGTLRALGVLVAVLGGDSELVGVEEPEIALHPGAFGVLRDALSEGARESQVLVTSQSPELLDDPDLQPEQLLAVEWTGDQTKIGPVSAADASLVRDRLFTAGELLRQSRLEPA